MATLYEFAHHRRHKAGDEFPALLWGSKTRRKAFYELRQWYKPDGRAVMNESCCDMKVDSPQIRREGGQCEGNFPDRRVTNVQE